MSGTFRGPWSPHGYKSGDTKSLRTRFLGAHLWEPEAPPQRVAAAGLLN